MQSSGVVELDCRFKFEHALLVGIYPHKNGKVNTTVFSLMAAKTFPVILIKRFIKVSDEKSRYSFNCNSDLIYSSSEGKCQADYTCTFRFPEIIHCFAKPHGGAAKQAI